MRDLIKLRLLHFSFLCWVGCIILLCPTLSEYRYCLPIKGKQNVFDLLSCNWLYIYISSFRWKALLWRHGKNDWISYQSLVPLVLDVDDTCLLLGEETNLRVFLITALRILPEHNFTSNSTRTLKHDVFCLKAGTPRGAHSKSSSSFKRVWWPITFISLFFLFSRRNNTHCRLIPSAEKRGIVEN